MVDLFQRFEDSFAPQASTTAAPTDVFLASRDNATETDYAFDSCKPFYKARVETADSTISCGTSATVDHSKPVSEDGESAGTENSLSVQKTLLPALSVSSRETVPAELEISTSSSECFDPFL